MHLFCVIIISFFCHFSILSPCSTCCHFHFISSCHVIIIRHQYTKNQTLLYEQLLGNKPYSDPTFFSHPHMVCVHAHVSVCGT